MRFPGLGRLVSAGAARQGPYAADASRHGGWAFDIYLAAYDLIWIVGLGMG